MSYYKVRDEIIERDNYTCQKCGHQYFRGRRNKGVVHHIDGHASNNNPTNLVFLCRKCHMKVHAWDRHWLNPEMQKVIAYAATQKLREADLRRERFLWERDEEKLVDIAIPTPHPTGGHTE